MTVDDSHAEEVPSHEVAGHDAVPAGAGTGDLTTGDPTADDDGTGTGPAPEDPALTLLRRLRGDPTPGAPGAGGGAAGRRRRAGTRRRPTSGRREQWSGARADDLDPVRLGAVLDGFVAERGWDLTLAQARVLADWAVLVGPDVAAHCRPVSLSAGELRLAAESTAWATQLRLLAATLVTRLEEQVGRGVVRRITVTGPVAPSWRHGPRAVPGARGPRDTYG